MPCIKYREIMKMHRGCYLTEWGYKVKYERKENVRKSKKSMVCPFILPRREVTGWRQRRIH